MLFVNSRGQILAGLRPKRSYFPHIQSVICHGESFEGFSAAVFIDIFDSGFG